MAHRKRPGHVVAREDGWEKKPYVTIWKRPPPPRPPGVHPDLKFTCSCGYTSKTEPEHTCWRKD